MGLKQDNDNSIDAMKAMTDASLPNLPSQRISSHKLREGFDNAYNQMKEINDRTADAFEFISASKADSVHSHAIPDVTGLNISLSAKSDKAQFASVNSLMSHGIASASSATSADAVTTAPTGVSISLLNSLVVEANVNSINVRYNTLAAETNEVKTKLNELIAKFNALLTWLGTTNTAGLTGNFNSLRLAGAS